MKCPYCGKEIDMAEMLEGEGENSYIPGGGNMPLHGEYAIPTITADGKGKPFAGPSRHKKKALMIAAIVIVVIAGLAATAIIRWQSLVTLVGGIR